MGAMLVKLAPLLVSMFLAGLIGLIVLGPLAMIVSPVASCCGYLTGVAIPSQAKSIANGSRGKIMLKRFTRRRREPEDPNAQYRDAIEDLRSPNVTAKPPPQPYEPQEDAASDKAESPAQYGMRLLERTAILRRAVEKLDDDIYDALVGGSAPSEAVKNTDAGILLDDLLDCALAVAHENGLSVEQRLREARTRTGDW